MIQPKRTTAVRRAAFVLLVVLVVIVILSLSGYKYTERAVSESKVAVASVRSAQAKLAADAGVNWAMAVLATPERITQVLNGVLFHNPNILHGKVVPGDPTGQQFRFSFVRVTYEDDETNSTGNTGYAFGFSDEGGKINLNAVMKADSTGKTLYKMLMAMDPTNMTDEIAASICIWLGGSDTTTLANGAKDDYYSSLQPAYQGKYGPIDSLEELLLVKGVTPQLLFGNDRNKNGTLDPDEDPGINQVCNAGWSRYLTVYGRDRNVDVTGKPRVSLSGTDLTKLFTDLTTAGLDENLATYIILYLQNGPATVGKGGVPDGNPGGLSAALIAGNNSTTKVKSPISSPYDLMNSFVSIKSKDPKEKPTYYASPLNTVADLETGLTALLDKTTTSKATEFFGRININTAPRAVLQALPGLKPEQAQNIFDARPQLISDNPLGDSYTTPAWLITQVKPALTADTLKNLDKYITTRSEVYRFQVVGYSDSGPQTARVEAVVDANGGQPRLLYRRDITELGGGFQNWPASP